MTDRIDQVYAESKQRMDEIFRKANKRHESNLADLHAEGKAAYDKLGRRVFITLGSITVILSVFLALLRYYNRL